MTSVTDPLPSPVLRTARLLLEPYTPADEEDFVRLFQDRRVTRWMGDGPQSEEEDRALFHRVFHDVYPTRRFDVWAVREQGGLVGHAEVKRTAATVGHEIVYALAPAAWGRGLGTELVGALLDHAFGTLGLSEVNATVADANTASLALLARGGFRHVRDVAEDDGTTTRVLTRTAGTRPRTR